MSSRNMPTYWAPWPGKQAAHPPRDEPDPKKIPCGKLHADCDSSSRVSARVMRSAGDFPSRSATMSNRTSCDASKPSLVSAARPRISAHADPASKSLSFDTRASRLSAEKAKI